MSTLRANFRQTNTVQIATALSAVRAEINSIDLTLNNTKDASIKFFLIARKKQLQQMLISLEAQKQQGRDTVYKSENKDFISAAALVYVFLARQAAEQSTKARQIRKEIKKASHNAPKLVA